MPAAAQVPDPAMATPVKKRIDALDVLRGLVMALMVLDHTRDFCGIDQFDATDLSKASTFAFLTRFVTHYCAACFVFLAGTGAYLSLSRGKTKAQAARFLLSRGLWLIFLELTVIGFGFTFAPPFTFGFLQVIWVIGLSMIILAGLIYLPLPAIGAYAFILIAGHNLLDAIPSKPGNLLWQLLHTGGQAVLPFGMKLYILYPLIPWTGIMAAGYCFGVLYRMEAHYRRKLLTGLGFAALALFVILRSGNFYGDDRPWHTQANLIRSVLSFINIEKYPPSLDYVLITLGPALLFLAMIEPVHNGFTKLFVVFGRVPLFFYILHIYLVRLCSGAVYVYCKANHLPFGVSLGVVYVIWAMVVVILYFPSRGFMQLRQRRSDWWLSYL